MNPRIVILDHKIYARRPEEFYDPKRIGVNDICEYSAIKSANISNAFSYDPFHTLKNFAFNIIQVLVGDHGLEKKHVALYHNEMRFLRITNPLRLVKQAETGPAPWLLKKGEIDRADAVLNCILLPSGSKDHFNVKNMLNVPSFAKGVEKIRYMCSYLTFCLSFTDVKTEYLKLFSLCANVCSDIQSPTFDIREDPTSYKECLTVDNLFLRVVEMLSLFECMLPDTVQTFANHELLDIVASIKDFGPIHCWWTLAGERVMHKIKICTPTGGVSPLTTIHNRFVRGEENVLNNFNFKKTDFLDNNMLFKDNMIKLNGKLIEVPANAYDEGCQQHLMNCVYNFFLTSDTSADYSDHEKNSVFFRLYRRYVYRASKLTFIKWLTQSFGDGSELGVHNESDWNNIKDDALKLIMWKPKICYSAVVKGILFKARGIQCSERNKYVDCHDGEFSDSNDSLFQTWYYKKDYSSWCKFKNWYIDARNNNIIAFKVYYGQLNWFFRIDWQHDKSIVKNIAFANVTTRRVNEKEFNCSQCVLQGSKEDKIQFVPLYFLESTNVAMCATNKEDIPILSTNYNVIRPNCRRYYDQNLKAIAKLHFIDMHPERRFVETSVEEGSLPEN